MFSSRPLSEHISTMEHVDQMGDSLGDFILHSKTTLSFAAVKTTVETRKTRTSII